MTDELMGRNEYARHRRCSPNAVAKAEHDGRIAEAVVRGERGKFVGIKWDLADQLWSANTDPAEAAKSGKTIEISGAGQALSKLDRAQADQPSADQALADQALADQAPVDQAPTAADRDPHGYYKARAERERYQAKQAELDYLQAIGELVSRRDLREMSARRYKGIREKFLNLPDRLTPVLAAERDPARVHAELTSEIKRVLNELSDDARAEAARGAAERVAT
jgi:molecular chaperone GrpE (heat shock protein)